MEYTFMLKQHIGAPAVAVVKEGDKVKRGQKLAMKPEGALGANIFSSVSGEVKSVDETQIMIAEAETDFDTYLPLTGQTPIELIEEAGIVGLGGAGFPTAVKLNVHFENGGTVIVNAAECEPILSHNIARIEKEPQKLLAGLAIVMEQVQAKKGIIAVKGVHKEAVAALKQANTKENVSVFELENIYPMGGGAGDCS